MKHITFYLDFISPYAWLAFERLPQELQGLSYHVVYRPVLLGALLQQHANPGPAGIAPKRAWTYRHVAWLGHALGCGLDMPARHPFNPLPLLRQALACSDDALDPQRLQALSDTLSAQERPDPQGPLVRAKALLRANTDQAAARGVFGVPAFEVDGRLFWGLDGLPMLRAYLQGDPWFDGSAWDAERALPHITGLS